MKLHHTAFWTGDLERLENFYIKYFGGKVLFRHSINDFKCTFMEIAGSFKIEIMTRTDISGHAADERIGYSHLSIEVESREKVNELTDFFMKENVKILKNREQYDDGFYESSVCDPDGNIIELAYVDRTVNPHV
ncbi:MAG: VOC family protein [Spirochaetes bacterium]|nr:VOC family protein [Spirochaetota bacterium]